MRFLEIAVVALVAVLSSLVCAGEDEKISMEIHFPHMPLLHNERVVVHIIIRNGSEVPFAVRAIPAEALGSQLVITSEGEVDATSPLPSERKQGLWRSVLSDVDSRLDVPPGGEYIFPLGILELSWGLPRFTERLGKRRLVARLLVGEERWLTTEYAYEVVGTDVDNAPAVYAVPFPLPGKPDFSVPLYQLKVGDSQCILRLSRGRPVYVCHVPDRRTPRFSYDVETELLTVSFGDPEMDPVVYNVRHCKVVRGGEETTPLWFWLETRMKTNPKAERWPGYPEWGRRVQSKKAQQRRP